MHKRIFALSIFILFSFSIASNSSKNYKNQTLKEKINQMKVLGLDEASSSKKSNAHSLKKGMMIKSQMNVAEKARLIGKEPMIPSNGSRDCEGLSEDDCEWMDYCVWTNLGCDDFDDEYEDECPFFDNPEECLVAGCEWDEDGCFRPDEDDDGEWEDDCEGLSQDECTMIDFCMWNYEEGFCHRMDDDESTDCDDGYLQDCSDNDCCPESWIGDGFSDCEDQAYGCDLSCYDNDGGDCGGEGDDGGDDGNADDGGTGGSDCVDCEGNDCSGYEQWIGDGICDDGAYGIFYNCLEFECDSGDCGFDSNGECGSDWEDDGGDDGEESECLNYSHEDCLWFDYCMWTDAGCVDYDGSECENYDCMDQCYDGYEGWIGDGYCDDGSWGLYFNCEEFECDNGDCLNETEDCEGNSGDDGGDFYCSDLEYEDCVNYDFCIWTWNPDDPSEGGLCVEAGSEDDGGSEGCDDGYIEDCSDSDCCPENWVGDGFADCEDQAYGCDLSCYDNDGGDCGDNGDGGDDGGNFECSDLGYEECIYIDACEWISDSNVDPGFGGECVDAGSGDDGGNEGCADNQLEDCSDDDCCPASWVGDGFADCEDQAYGCDLSCYDNDGGDCSDSADDGGDDGGWEPEAALMLGEGVAVPGGEVQIPLFLESTVPVSGVQFTINSTPSDWQTVVNLGVWVDDCFEANFNNTDNGTIGLIYSLTGCEFNSSDNDNPIATLTFEISEEAEWGGVIELYFTELIVASSGGGQVAAEGYGSLITIGMIGDANHDGEVNVIDAVAMIQFVLEFEEPTESNFWASDINNDGSLNILDVVLLIEMILDN